MGYKILNSTYLLRLLKEFGLGYGRENEGEKNPKGVQVIILTLWEEGPGTYNNINRAKSLSSHRREFQRD